MKINILTFGAEQEHGYKNIGFFQCNNLDWICDSAEVTELKALDIIEYLQPEVLDGVLNNWFTKIARHGKLIISFSNPESLTSLMNFGSLDIAAFNKSVHGIGKIRNYTIKEILDMTARYNFTVTKRFSTDLTQTILIFERP